LEQDDVLDFATLSFHDKRVQRVDGMKSSALTISVSVELRALMRCLLAPTMGKPRPFDNLPPESPLMFG
jgi:hypothetical protein